MRETAMRLCESLDQGRYFRVRNVVISFVVRLGVQSLGMANIIGAK